MSSAIYQRRDGTSGICGQLYETKFLSLIYYRAKYDDNIKQFQLASNIAEAGAFDDICFKVKVKGFSKPFIVFIQCKHKEDSNKPPEVDMKKYFLSYIKIIEIFKSQDDLGSLFHGDFQDTECYFVIYTNGKEPHPIDNVTVEGDLTILNELIDTGGIARQPYKHKEDVVDSLCEQLAKDRTISLAKQIATFMGREMTFQDLLSDEYNIILLHHVFLAQNVFDVSEIKSEGHRVAIFRQDFFNTTDEYLTLFKDTLLQEIFRGQTMELDEINNLLSDFIAEPTDVTKLSKLIGTVVTYNNNGQLEFVEKFSNICNQKLNEVQITRSTVNEAVKLATKDIVTKVPAAFGNKDLSLRGNDKKKERRINHLKSKIIEILDKFKPEKMIVIDGSLVTESLIEEGFLELNGGIAGAIGNIFVPDHNTKYMKITDSCESLGTFAKSLYTKLDNEIHNLHEYKFNFNFKNVPRFSLFPSDYDKSLGRDFLNNLLFYSKQADENEMEEILKNEIEENRRDFVNHFQAKTDAMFLKYHDGIQKWWMQPQQAYLTKDSDIFEEAINSIMKDPLMSSINLTYYMSKTQHFKYSFHEDVVSSWHLQDHSTTVIITENSVLTVVKVLQHLKNKDHAVLDLEYIVNLPTTDIKKLCAELKETHDNKTLIFVCDKLPNKRNKIKTLETIGKTVLKKKAIIITSHISHEPLQKYFPKAISIIKDEKNSLNDLNEMSQKNILETRVIFQGTEVRLNLLLDNESKAYVNGDVLNIIISKETIIIGKLTTDRQYDETKHLYVDRFVKKTNFITETPLGNALRLKTLFDIEDDVVLVTAEPGMGKSTLLNQLSLKTKTEHPQVWIVRVNLLEYSRQFYKWKQANTVINTLVTIKFLCQVMLSEKLVGKGKNVEFELEEDEKGVVYLTQCTGDQLTKFQLQLFLHFFNKRNMILLFDGFDEICPYYMDEVIKCIQTINSHKKKHKIWVTSRSYFDAFICLQQAFGEPYKLEHFSSKEKTDFLMKIWQSNLILTELNKLQLQNVYNFLQFVIEPEKEGIQVFELPLQYIYIDAADYIINKIKTTTISLWTFPDNYTERFEKVKKKIHGKTFFCENNVKDNNPLNLFLRALFLINRIKDVSHSTNKWNRNVNTFTFYEKYLETKLKTRFKDKNKMDIYNPDIMKIYKTELADCVGKHKKLAAYAIFHGHNNKLFNEKDLKQIKEIIKLIEKGEEKTGLIYSVEIINAYKIPIFIHMTFAEYFAVEYICDLLKHANDSNNILKIMDFIFNVMLSTSNLEDIRAIFDSKMKIDKKLMSILRKHDKVIFNLLTDESIIHLKYLKPSKKKRLKKLLEDKHWAPFVAIRERQNNLKFLFLSIFEGNKTIRTQIFLKRVAKRENWDELIESFNNSCKNICLPDDQITHDLEVCQTEQNNKTTPCAENISFNYSEASSFSSKMSKYRSDGETSAIRGLLDEEKLLRLIFHKEIKNERLTRLTQYLQNNNIMK